MKWLKSTTQKSYIIEGKKIPQCITPNNDYLALSDEGYNKFVKNAVIKSLISGGAILVTDVEPQSPTQQASALTKEKAMLIRENTELKEKLKAAEDNSAAKVELETTKAELVSLEEKYKALEEKYAELEKEAKDTIKELKAQLKDKE